MRPRYCVLLLLLGVGIVAYLAQLVPLALNQRKLLYYPIQLAAPASAWGLPDARTLDLTTSVGEHLTGWYQPPAEGKPLFLSFHGNGGNMSNRAALFRRFIGQGWGFLAIDYQGYGASPGVPTEPALERDGEAAYAKAIALGYPPSRIVIFGESLGSGVAVPLAAAHPTKALILDSAFSSTVDIAADQYPYYPVRLLMLDTYRSEDVIGQIAEPKLFVHGSADTVVPIRYDRKLYALAKEPKAFIEVEGGGHLVMEQAFGKMTAWLEALPN